MILRLLFHGREVISEWWVDGRESLQQFLDLFGERVYRDELLGTLKTPESNSVLFSTPELMTSLSRFKAGRQLPRRLVFSQLRLRSDSGLFSSSFLGARRASGQGLPHHAFLPAFSSGGLRLRDQAVRIPTNIRAASDMHAVPQSRAGYLLLHWAHGVPSLRNVPVDKVVRKAVLVSFFDRVRRLFVGAIAEVEASMGESEAGVWRFNRPAEAGTNPLCFKWIDDRTAKDIDIVIELVVSIRYG